MSNRLRLTLRALLLPLGVAVISFSPIESRSQDLAELVKKERIVESAPRTRNSGFTPAEEGQTFKDFEWVAAREKSRGFLRFPRDKGLRLRENTELRVFPSRARQRGIFDIQKGEIYLHSRGDWDGATVRSGSTTITPRSTQFVVRVDDNGTITVIMIEGAASVRNPQGEENMESKDQVEVRPGQAPRKLAKIDARNTVQWCLYYPAVLHLPEIGLSPRERRVLRDSIEAYEDGDLLNALGEWPKGFAPRTSAAMIFRAMVVLAVGEVEEARQILRSVGKESPGRRAIETMIDAVNYNPPSKDTQALQSVRQPTEAVKPKAALMVPLVGTSSITEYRPTERHSVSEWLARSYWEQSRVHSESLNRALEAAKHAWNVAESEGQRSGYAAARIAEVLFSLGFSSEAKRWLEESLRLMSRNAQAWTLQGFIFSGENHHEKAFASYEKAIECDSALGNAWLGRGLSKIRRGDLAEGRRDIQTAMMLEPNRSLLHSYLGKASSQLGLAEAARKDLEFAKVLDPEDPTPWLYSGLSKQHLNRPNEAISDLQRALSLNDNRALYRSRLLLDQDRAVKNTNLALLYQRNGMNQVAVREATRAVNSDYTNPSAHLFLANAFDALRDPTRIELRYETPWFHELLMANLLAPVGGGRLSQFVSQQEYSKLFESDGLGGSFLNEWRSDGEWRSTSSVFGTAGRTEFGVDLHHFQANGDRPNADEDRLEIYAQLKHEFTPNDTLYFLGKYQDQESGDTRKLFDQGKHRPDLHFEENQEPGLLLAGWNHRWAPGSHTLFLGGRLAVEQTLSDRRTRQALVKRTTNGLIAGGLIQVSEPGPGIVIETLNDELLQEIETDSGDEFNYSDPVLQAIGPLVGTGHIIGDVGTAEFDFLTQRRMEIYSAELQHIQKVGNHTALIGGRFQTGEVEAMAQLTTESLAGDFPDAQSITTDFKRHSFYAYDFWSPVRWLTLVAGASWDRVDHPENFRNPPVSNAQKLEEKISGKIGFTLSPTDSLTVRGIYSEGLGGLTFDESVTLEPVQLSGFNQAYRTVLSESLVGAVEAPEFTIMGLSLEGSLLSTTWWGASVNLIEQDVDRTVGVFTGYDSNAFNPSPAFYPDGTSQHLAYKEQSFEASINHLIGDELAVGAFYRITRSELRDHHLEIPTDNLPTADLDDEATLQELSLFANWNSPKGFFGRIEANWYSQNLDDDPDDSQTVRHGDEFWQVNAMLGYRFKRNQGEISMGVLNINDVDYRLSPLNPYGELLRERTAFLRCRFSF